MIIKFTVKSKSFSVDPSKVMILNAFMLKNLMLSSYQRKFDQSGVSGASRERNDTLSILGS